MKATARGVGESPVMEPRNTNTNAPEIVTRDCHQRLSPGMVIRYSRQIDQTPIQLLHYLDESLTWGFQVPDTDLGFPGKCSAVLLDCATNNWDPIQVIFC